MNAAAEIQAIRRLAGSQGLRLSKQGDGFFLIDADTTSVVLGWGQPGGVHLDEVRAFLRAEPQARTA